jgi:hypothetical protein
MVILISGSDDAMEWYVRKEDNAYLVSWKYTINRRTYNGQRWADSLERAQQYIEEFRNQYEHDEKIANLILTDS